ncbi:MAG: hypothetical protein ACLFQG_07990, partial [Desulfovermiculus sp.]
WGHDRGSRGEEKRREKIGSPVQNTYKFRRLRTYSILIKDVLTLIKEYADILYLVNAREPMHYPDDIAEAAILFHKDGGHGMRTCLWGLRMYCLRA